MNLKTENSIEFVKGSQTWNKTPTNQKNDGCDNNNRSALVYCKIYSPGSYLSFYCFAIRTDSKTMLGIISMCLF